MSDSFDYLQRLADLEADTLYLKAQIADCNELNLRQEKRLARLTKILHQKINNTLLVAIGGFAAVFVLLIKVDLNTDNGHEIFSTVLNTVVTLAISSGAVGAGVAIAKRENKEN